MKLAGTSDVKQLLMRLEHFQHLLGVVFPVGGQVKQSSTANARLQKINKSRLYETTLVVTFLMPWVREEYLDSIKAQGLDTIAHNLYCIVTVRANIFDTTLFHQVKQLANAGTMNFYTDKVFPGRLLCHRDQRLPHAEANLQNAVTASRKYLFEMEHAITLFEAPA